MAAVGLRASGDDSPDWETFRDRLRTLMSGIEALGLRGAPEDFWRMSPEAAEADRAYWHISVFAQGAQPYAQYERRLVVLEKAERLMEHVGMPRAFLLRAGDAGMAALRGESVADDDGALTLIRQMMDAVQNREDGPWAGLPEDVWLATMGAFSRFVEEHRRSTGRDGFDRGFWTPRQVNAALFRLGTLEYELRRDDDGPFLDLHIPSDADTIPLLPGRRNVVVLILESFSREYIGYYNSTAQPSNPQPRPSYTPFLDSLLAHSLTYQHTFANGRKSIDAMPSALTSVPFFVEPFILTPSSLNELSGLADCLGRQGYSSAFFHGAPNSSMGFQAFARSAGFQHYLGLSEYCDDPRTGGRNDFDGHWAIWDEEFLQFTANAITERLHEPFMVGFFSASSHHPFRIPERYEGTFAGGPLPIHRTIQYSDNALRRFFQAASQQPWFRNTLFVLTADHTNQLQYPESLTSTGLFSIPIAIYDPSGQLPTGLLPGVMQQIDIMPTILRILGYDQPYAAFGKDMFNPDETPWAVNYSNDIYQYIEGDYTLLFDGQQPTGLYNYVLDPLQHHNLLADPAHSERRDRMLLRLKSIVQTYMVRMTTDHLVIRPDDLGQ